MKTLPIIMAVLLAVVATASAGPCNKKGLPIADGSEDIRVEQWDDLAEKTTDPLERPNERARLRAATGHSEKEWDDCVRSGREKKKAAAEQRGRRVGQ